MRNSRLFFRSRKSQPESGQPCVNWADSGAVEAGSSSSSGGRVRQRGIRSAALVATVAISTALIGFAPGLPSDVGAQNVENLRASAKRAADQLSKLQNQSDVLNEQYLELEEQVASLKDRQTENQSEVRAAQQRLDKAKSEASSYLVEAYVGAGVNDGGIVGSADPNEALNQRVLLSMLNRDRTQLADSIQVTKDDLDAVTAELKRTGTTLAKRQSEQRKVVAELKSSVANQQQILNGANAELNAAIRAEQERREAQAAERAQRAAEAARRQADAARQATESQAARQATDRQATARPNASTPQNETRRPAASRPTGGAATGSTGTTAPNRPSGGSTGGSTFVPPAVVSPPSSGAAGAIAAAKTRLGTPYRWGGVTPAGFDCSGLMLWSWAQVGVSLPRTSRAQKAATQRISYSQLQPGDLVFSGNPVYHVGMYIGGGQMIHSPSTGDVVKISAVRAGGSTSYGRVR